MPAESFCAGCGRLSAAGTVSCPGCGRALEGGSHVPPGWTVVSTAPEGAGVEPPAAAAAPTLAALDDPFRTAAGVAPLPTPAADPRPAYQLGGGAGWRLRPRLAAGVQAANMTMPRFTVPAAPEAAEPRSNRLLFWVLSAGILATSASALIIVVLHVVWGR